MASLLKKHWGPLKNEEKSIRHYTRQIVEGLKYLHSQKIVHRDIKGDNVLVNTYSGVIKISDFGTSKRLSGINPSSASFAGTMQFMAPEVIDAGHRGYGMKADIWSLGCTVIEMATGLPPFYELGSPHAAVFKVGFHKIHPEIPEEMSDKAKSFLKRCFDPDPEQRASAAELLSHPFLAGKHARPKSGDNRARPKSADALPLEAQYKRSQSTPVHQETLPSPVESRPRGTSMTMAGGSQCHLLVQPAEFPSPTTSTASSGYTSEYTSDGSEAFNQVKSHAERRAEVVQLLTESRDEVCYSWEKRIAENSPRGCCPVPKDTLYQVLDSFRDYFRESRDEIVVTVTNQLVRDCEKNSEATNGLTLALIVFQDVTSDALKKRRIKPHFLFAIDGLVKAAINLALGVLSPESSYPSVFETSDTPTITISGPDYDKEQEQTPMPINEASPDVFDLRSQIHLLTEENVRLMKELVEVQTALRQQLLANVVHHKRMLAEQSSPPSSSAGTTDDTHVRPPNSQLVEWLQSLEVGNEVIDKFVHEEFTYQDVMNCVTYDDLCHLQIRGGPRCRIWGAILSNRSNNS